MKALFISNDPSVFSSESTTFSRMKQYADAIGELHILSIAKKREAVQHHDNLHLYSVSGNRLLALWNMVGQAKKLIRTHGIEVVSAQDPFEHGWVAQKAVQNTNAKLHIQVHTDYLSPWFVEGKGFRAPRVRISKLQALRVRIADYIVPKADGIRVVSKRIKESMEVRYKEALPPTSIIPIAVSFAPVSAVPLPAHNFTFSLITVGRLEPEKRIEDILYALARIQQLYPSVGLFIVGEGRQRKHLEKLTQKLGLSDKVQFLGWVDNSRALVKSAHAYIQASAYEGYGLTLIEAALAKVPIITTDVGIVGEVLNGYEDVLSAPVADPTQLSVHITGIIEDHQARISLALNAQAKALAHVKAWEHQPQRVADDLRRVLG